MRKNLLAILFLALMLFGLDEFMAAHAFTVYHDRNVWEAQVSSINGEIATETFDNNIPQSDEIRLDNGTISVMVPRGRSGGNNRVQDGYYLGRVGHNIDHPDEIRWEIPGTHNIGFFADFTSVAANGLTLTGNFDGVPTTFVVYAENNFNTEGDFGIILDTEDSISLSWNQVNAGSEQFTIDNFSIASVGEPRTKTLYGIGNVVGGPNLYTIDIITGEVNNVGGLGVRFEGGGLSFDENGNLYGLSNEGNLYSVAPCCGNATLIGNIGFNYFIPSSFAIINGKGYALNDDGGLIEIDLSTGQAIGGLIGHVDFPFLLGLTSDYMAIELTHHWEYPPFFT